MGRSLAAGAPPNFRATATCRHRFPLGYDETKIGQVLPEGAESGRSDQLAEDPPIPTLFRELEPSGFASCQDKQPFDLRACAGRRSLGAPAVSPVDEFGCEKQRDCEGELGESVSWPAVGVAA